MEPFEGTVEAPTGGKIIYKYENLLDADTAEKQYIITMSVNSVYYTDFDPKPISYDLEITKTFIIDIVDPCKNEYITLIDQVGHTTKSQNSVNAEWTTASLLQ